MSYLFGWLFDMWNAFWFYVGEVVDNALDVWDFDEDPEAGLVYDPVAGRCNGDGEAYCVCPRGDE